MELAFNNVLKYLDASLILKNITFSVYNNEKVGIVGVNGSGKSTILKLIAGIYNMSRDDKGSISIPRGKSVSYLPQVINYPEGLKVREVLNEAFKKLYEIEDEIKKAEKTLKNLSGNDLNKALEKYSSLQELYEVKGGYEKEERLSKVSSGLNFNEDFLNKDFDVLSGGEKTTVILGKILLEKPDILLLDEPTNHLDMAAMEWLEGYLKAYKGIVLVVSHDRYFLDNTVNKIIEIEDMESKTYSGNYSSYVKQKDDDNMIQFNQFKEQQKKIKAMEKTIKELRDWAARVDNVKFFKRAESMKKRLDKMQKIEKPKLQNDSMRLKLTMSERSGKDVVSVKNLNKSFQKKVLFKDAGLDIKYKDRACIIGKNGSGKSTLIKMLLGEEPCDSGSLKIGESVLYSYLPQIIAFKDEEKTVLECFREDINMLEGAAREYLSKYMFYGSDVFKKVSKLSGGERVRLKLSKLLYDDINLLILDEPTNHLDIESIETLESALEDFKGTILFISHDRYFINKIGNKIFEIEHKVFKEYDGNYDFYKEEKNKIISVEEENEKKEKIKKIKNKISHIDENKKRERDIKKLEDKILSLEEEIKKIDDEMNLAESNYEKLKDLFSKKEEIKKELDKTMENWLEFSS